jgi:HEAT repeat protein
MQAKEAQGALLQALEDPNFYVRRAAINAIGKLGIPSLGSVLLPLLETPDSRIQRTVIIALRRLRTHQAIPKMIALLEQHTASPSPRDLPLVKTLVIALGDLQAQEAVTVLIKVLRGYVGARSLAAIALGQIGDPRAGPAMVEVLRDKSTNLQLAALKSLGKLKYQQAAPKVRRFLAASDPRKRRVAAQTLGQLQDKGAISELLKIAHSDTSPLVRPAALEALSLIGNASLLTDLFPLVEDTNAYLRATLADTLCSLYDGSDAANAALQQLAEDNVEHVALSAKHAIQSLEDGNDAVSPDPAPLERPSEDTDDQEGPKIIAWFRHLFHR